MSTLGIKIFDRAIAATQVVLLSVLYKTASITVRPQKCSHLNILPSKAALRILKNII